MGRLSRSSAPSPRTAHAHTRLKPSPGVRAAGRARTPGAWKARLTEPLRVCEPERSLRPTMILRKKLSYLWTLGLCLVASKSPPKVPSITNETFIAECLRFHNEARTRVSPPAANMKYMVRKNLG